MDENARARRVPARSRPPSFPACTAALDDLCDRLTALQHRAAEAHPEVEHDLPIVFNEWCTTWGDPQHDKVVAIARTAAGLGRALPRHRCRLVQGREVPTGAAAMAIGFPSAKLFPQGLEATAAAIRERGLIPGLWFEMETVGSQSAAFSRSSIICSSATASRSRCASAASGISTIPRPSITSPSESSICWNRCGFGYSKVDYNETARSRLRPSGRRSAKGCADRCSGIYRFFEKIRARLPELVIENCASGGHRLEPSMLARTAMSSFSDAHELVEIPIIAANLHRLMLPRQSQIWAVLHRADSDQRLAYSLAATFLGRMCLRAKSRR